MTDIEAQERVVEAGKQRLRRLSSRLEPALIDAIGEAEFADRAADQPWLIAGVSDGMGLQTTLAAIEAGVLQRGVGVYWEPPTLLEVEDGEPVSPVHWARYQNAEALEAFAAERGAELDVMSADMILAPNRGLKGDPKGEIPDFPEDVRRAVETARRETPLRDVVFIDSVAFGKWICPREGEEPVEVPSVDEQGRIVQTSTKKYHPRGYQETLDTMGRNHGRLLDELKDFGWLGEDAVTAFFTWAGGSQNVGVLEGIYGRGSLGDAKIVAERDVAKFRMEHGRELGDHAIVRFPAFLSAALLAIPGGALFGLVSRRVLEEQGVYREMPELASRMLRQLFGSEWVRSNPIAQIELDAAETLHMPEIREAVSRAHERIETYRADRAENDRGEPIPIDDSRELLAGLVPGDYTDILRRFRPEEQLETAGETESDFEVAPEDRADGADAPRASLLAAALPAIGRRIADEFPGRNVTRATERVEFLDDLDTAVDELDGELELDGVRSRGGRETAIFVRRARTSDGETAVRSELQLELGEAPADASSAEPPRLSRPVGHRSEVDGSVAETYWPRTAGEGRLWDLAGVLALAETALRADSRVDVLDDANSWSFSLESSPEEGDRLLTYLTEDSESAAAVVADDGRLLLEVASG